MHKPSSLQVRAGLSASLPKVRTKGKKARTPFSRSTSLISNAHNVRINGGNFAIAGGDINTHPRGIPSEAAILAALKAIPNFRKIYQDMLSKATPGTGTWLLKNEEFRIWLEPNGDIKIFWGSGIPGAGKTILASIVIQRLEALSEEVKGPICVCYFYFRYSDHAEVTVRRVLEVLVKQTLERHPECLEIADRAYARHLREETEPTEEQLLGLLHELNEAMAITFYVLDALDEAPPKIQLAIVQALAPLDVKLFITSRPLATVAAAVPEAHSFRIVARDEDIELHILRGISKAAELLSLLRQEGPSLRDDIVSSIKRNSGGMFLHASLQVDALSECINVHQVRRALDGFPFQIEEVYLQTWNRILDQNTDAVPLIKSVFIWVLNASRSMTINELERAVAASSATCKYDPELVVPGSTLMTMCRGLVILEEESRLVRLIHYTAKTPLQRLLHDTFPHPHSFLATVCMTHLADCGLQKTTMRCETDFTAALSNDALLNYASGAWAFHARQSLDVHGCQNHIARFIMECSAFPAFTSSDRTHAFDLLTPLHIVAFYHLPLDLVQEARIGDPNITTKVFQQSPLIMACQSGNEDFVARLAAFPNSQVNLVDIEGWSALMHAAWNGYKGIVDLILVHPDIQVNLVDNRDCSALILAAGAGHEGVVTLLLSRPEIQVNLVSDLGWSALILAAGKGHKDTVALLLAHPEIQINLVGKDRWSALMLAVYFGHEDVVKILLGARSNVAVNTSSYLNETAIKVAAQDGREAIVRMLLQVPGIDVNIKSIVDGHNAMETALAHGHHGVVRLLEEFMSQNPISSCLSGNDDVENASRDGNGYQ